MRSKWLDWTPSPEIIQRPANPEATKPTKSGFVGFVGSAPTHFPITREPKPPSQALKGDPYAERVQAALRKINNPAYPPRMILWLEKATPELYAELTERLPDEIQRMWEAHAPLEQFGKTLARLMSEHRRAFALYQAYLASRDGENGGRS